MNYSVNNGIYNLDFKLSKIEKDILDYCCNLLETKGFQYLSVPITIKQDTFIKQGAALRSWVLDQNANQLLGGSAEQGILEYFTNKYVKSLKIYSKNSCFRTEQIYEDLARVKEFQKVEQFIFCEENEWEENFSLVIHNALDVLEKFEIKYRVIDVTEKDEGYHKKKYDIEILTKKYGWLETHSCTYFGDEQTKRFNITGSNHTISCTGIATPRVLIPIIERGSM